MRWYGWLLVGVAVAFAAVLLVYAYLRKDKDGANSALADIVGAVHAQRIADSAAKLKAAETKLGAESAEAAALRAQVEAQRQSLKGKYQELNLTPEEIERRFRDLRA